jgi:hypothetical protein
LTAELHVGLADNYPGELSAAVQGDPETYLSEGYVFNIERRDDSPR